MRSRSSATSPHTDRGLDQRGLTLMEVTIVVVLASLVMLALLGFYINSQATWTDASSQTITQRELTAVVERLTDRVHGAASAQVADNPGPQNQHISLYDKSGTLLYSLEWRPDSLLYETAPSIPGGWHPIVGSHVVTFQLVADTSTVTLVNLTLHTATGKSMTMSSTIAMMNGKKR